MALTNKCGGYLPVSDYRLLAMRWGFCAITVIQNMYEYENAKRTTFCSFLKIIREAQTAGRCLVN